MPKDYRKHKLVKETSCKRCIHRFVCSHDVEKLCSNYLFGRSDEKGCGRCTCHYSREELPCFHCKHFLYR